ncbi:MAG: hypothetical protein JWO11_2847 [Nocardioides sp.]|nr:hypothetical protein [Nocardioides sp.]
MTTVAPRRMLLSRPAVERLAGLAGTAAPWSTEPTPAPPDPPALAPELRDALEVLAAPELLVDVDVAVGSDRVRAWHRFARGRVTALATAGGRVELCWYDDDLWRLELARAVTVTTPPASAEPPPGPIDLPFELLLGTGEAVRLERDDVFGELMGRYGAGLDAAGVRRLHTGSLGRLRAVVSGVGSSGAHRVGWVSWSLFADGWRALTPYTSGCVAMVRVHPVDPPRLGVEVARLMTTVLS